MFQAPDHPRYIAVIGPTASGKSALALELAEALGGELVNCDSVQIYRGFSIGAAQPTPEEFSRAPHHLWNLADWHEDFDARMYAERAERVIQDIQARGSMPILVGGTGLYLRALWRENWHDLPKSESLRAELALLPTDMIHERLRRLDPRRAAALHPNDRFRLQRALEINLLTGQTIEALPAEPGRRSEAFLISLELTREELHRRIEKRTRQMLAAGWIAEVEALLAAGVDPGCKPMKSIGYASILAFLEGRLPRASLEEAIIVATRQYAKRQETWFRKVKPDLRWDSLRDGDELLLELRKANISRQ